MHSCSLIHTHTHTNNLKQLVDKNDVHCIFLRSRNVKISFKYRMLTFFHSAISFTQSERKLAAFKKTIDIDNESLVTVL